MSDGALPHASATVGGASPKVGLVAGTEDSTPLVFRVAIAAGRLPAARRRRAHRPRRARASAR